MRFRPSPAPPRRFATGMPASLETARFALETRLLSAGDRTVSPLVWSTTLATVSPRRRLNLFAFVRSSGWGQRGQEHPTPRTIPNETNEAHRGAQAHRPKAYLCGSNQTRQSRRPVSAQYGRRAVATFLEKHCPGLAAARGGSGDHPSQRREG